MLAQQTSRKGIKFEDVNFISDTPLKLEDVEFGTPIKQCAECGRYFTAVFSSIAALRECPECGGPLAETDEGLEFGM